MSEDMQWKNENSLTSPSDRDPSKKYKLRGGAPPLNDEETEAAMEALHDKRNVEKYPVVDRMYADPAVPQQTYGIFSFVPSKGATPDKDGFYGFAKIRGCFSTQHEADERVEYLIRNVDSYHKYYTTYVGRPFPCTLSSAHSAESIEVDIRKKATETISENIKQQKADEQKQIREIKDREKQLIDDTTNKVADDPYDVYTTLRVKKAQLTFTYLEHQKKMEEVKNILIKTRKEIEDMDKETLDYSQKFYNKYMDARRESGLPATDESFIKYLNEDADLGF